MENRLKESINILQIAQNVMISEALELQNIAKLLDNNFEMAVKLILNCPSRVVVTGIGKSALVAQKIVATFNSTGTPSIFMHSADAMHGDLGAIIDTDVVIMISKSGNTPEIKSLVPILRALPNKTIAITGNTSSYMALGADCILNTTVSQEACPNNLAPTTSTTAQMVMGDALAVALEVLRGFGTADFAKYHPGGALGKRLYMRVIDVLDQELCPCVSPDDCIKTVINEISSKRLGVTAVLGQKGQILGIITDGDIRRTLSSREDIFSLKAEDIMTKDPKTVAHDAMAFDAVEMLQSYDINNLLVTRSGTYCGVIHIHHLIREGII